MKAPNPRPCGSCPYRRDVPSGVWEESEYAKLPEYDKPTSEQPMAAFLCHQQDGHICSGWAGCHDMAESIGLRMAVATGAMSREAYADTLDHRAAVPLFESGREAADHGMADIETPGQSASRVIDKLIRKRGSA